VALVAGAALLSGGALAAPAAAEPAAITAKRAQIAQLQGELQRLDDQVATAAEAYNGARWRLGLVQRRIDQNQRVLTVATRNLRRSRAVLGGRLDALYRRPQPTLLQVMLSSGSLGATVDQIRLLDRVSRLDADAVGQIRGFRTQVITARRELVGDRRARRAEVALADRQRRRIEGLLAQRQQVLAGARSDLRRLVAEEQARQRRLAELARQRALAAQRAREAAERARRAAERQASAAAAASTPSSSGVAPIVATDALPSGAGNAAAAGIALQYQGVPYVWGGASPAGFDCSGLASYAYAKVGKSVPHYTGAIWAAFPKVPSGDLQAGDLVFFRGIGHMGIYIGGGSFVHAPRTGDVVKVQALSTRSDYTGAVRP
jgi:cell wall-associated NlpC family hydrolase